MKPLSERDENFQELCVVPLQDVSGVGMKPLSERDENRPLGPKRDQVCRKCRNEATL